MPDEGDPSSYYEVWDINDTSKPVRTMRCLPGCTADNTFVEGGLLFQVTNANKEIHVTEESSGTHVVTLNLFKPLSAITNHYSFLEG
ncbi:hypothetical protein Pelo_14281 [Pelomyxa schiedti]|nr:hypothetical protein Pelo_14281 [Pelomyxa schiedti]